MNILILLEDRDTSDLLTSLVEKEGHTVTDVQKMDSILEVLNIASPNIIFTDLKLPMSGEEYAIRLLKSYPASRNVKVILVSGHPDLRQITALCGADGYLQVPFSLQQLITLLKRHSREVKKMKAK